MKFVKLVECVVYCDEITSRSPILISIDKIISIQPYLFESTKKYGTSITLIEDTTVITEKNIEELLKEWGAINNGSLHEIWR